MKLITYVICCLLLRPQELTNELEKTKKELNVWRKRAENEYEARMKVTSVALRALHHINFRSTHPAYREPGFSEVWNDLRKASCPASLNEPWDWHIGDNTAGKKDNK